MVTIPKVLYTGRTYTKGGREGSARSHDGRLDIRLSPPGAPGGGTNPEQLLGAGWSSSLIGALRHASHARRIPFPSGAAIAAEVSLIHGEQGFFLQVRFDISLPGVQPEIAYLLVDAAQENCPYSKATRGNVAVAVNLLED
jgi:Ohr subfamily peroxiredoxin